MRKTKKLAYMALLTAAALTIFVLEAQIPVLVPIPGVKLGLANIITLCALMTLGRKDALMILTARLLLGALLVGSAATLLYSAAGGLCAYAVMCALKNAFPENRLWVMSALAAVGHNFGQLAAAVWVLKGWGILIYAPVLLASGIAAGAVTGLAAGYVIKRLKNLTIR